VKRGVDPQEFSLVAFGGAGPIHAVAIAKALRIPRVLVPLHPGHCSAFGALISDRRVDKILTRMYYSYDLKAEILDEEFRQLTRSAVEELSKEGFRENPILFRSIDMRYQGQNYELEVNIGIEPIDETTVAKALNQFASQHEAFSGASYPDAVIELVNLRVTAIGPSSKIKLEKIESGDIPHPIMRRLVHCLQKGFQETDIYRREDLPKGCRLNGPVIVEEIASTTIVPDGYIFTVDDYGLITIFSEEDKIA